MRRLPLPPDLVRDDVTRAVYKLGLDIANYVAAAADQPLTVTYGDRDRQTWLHYVDDHVLGVAYVAIDGQAVDELTARFTAAVPVIDAAQLDERIESAGSEDALRHALGAAFLLAPPITDRRFRGYFDRAFTHPSAAIRRYGVIGAGYAGWPELATSLQTLAENDSDEEVRAAANRMLGAMQRLRQEKQE
ncbi:MAG TPA: hypothetical protein VGF69_23580 [Thermoanaerobaculia bacterium]|jgi:hypothetical protein